MVHFKPRTLRLVPLALYPKPYTLYHSFLYPVPHARCQGVCLAGGDKPPPLLRDAPTFYAMAHAPCALPTFAFPGPDRLCDDLVWSTIMTVNCMESYYNELSRARAGRIPTLTRLPFDKLRPRARRGELVEGRLPLLTYTHFLSFELSAFFFLLWTISWQESRKFAGLAELC